MGNNEKYLELLGSFEGRILLWTGRKELKMNNPFDREPDQVPKRCPKCGHNPATDHLKMRDKIAELLSHNENAIQQAQAAVPDYPWSKEPTMSEVAYALCSTIRGCEGAIEDWHKLVVKLQAEDEVLRKTINQGTDQIVESERYIDKLEKITKRLPDWLLKVIFAEQDRQKAFGYSPGMNDYAAALAEVAKEQE